MNRPLFVPARHSLTPHFHHNKLLPKYRGGPGLRFFGAQVGLGLHTLGLGFFGLEKFTK
jgi:hypothetical protein